MRDVLILNYSIIKNGSKKGELNTRKKRIKFILRSLMTFKYSRKISNFILQHKYLEKAVYDYPILLSKIHRPYLYKNLHTKNKCNVILKTYSILDETFPAEGLKELYEKGSYLLTEIIGKNEEKYYINLCLYPNYDKEGELNLKFFDSKGEVVSTLTFSIFDEEIFIGGIQGLKKGADQSYIKEISKNLFGAFPKKILLESLYALKNSLGLEEFKIRAVSNEIHIYQSSRYKKKRVINSDYNSFLQSQCGVLNKGIWELPENLSRKKIEDIPSKKRSQCSKKYDIFDRIHRDIEGKLSK